MSYILVETLGSQRSDWDKAGKPRVGESLVICFQKCCNMLISMWSSPSKWCFSLLWGKMSLMLGEKKNLQALASCDDKRHRMFSLPMRENHGKIKGAISNSASCKIWEKTIGKLQDRDFAKDLSGADSSSEKMWFRKRLFFPSGHRIGVEVVGSPLLPLETLGFSFYLHILVPFSCVLLFAFIQLTLISNTCIPLFLITKRTYIQTSWCLRSLKPAKVLLHLTSCGPPKNSASKVIKTLEHNTKPLSWMSL